MRKRLTRASQVVIDLLVLSLAYALAFFVRFDGAPPAPMVGRIFLTGPYVVLLEYVVLLGFGVPRFAWRYVGLRETVRVGLALLAASTLLAVSRLVVGELQDRYVYLRHGVIPFGVLAVNLVVSFLGITGVRFLRRMLGERLEIGRAGAAARPRVDVLLVGAGQSGVLVARELENRPDLGLRPVAFLDDDPVKVGTVVHGIAVLGPTSELPRIALERGATQALITMANVPGSTIRRIRELCERAEIPVKIIPGLYEIVGGRVNLARMRDVAIEDLLGREAVQLDLEAIGRSLAGRVVMVTGAGGSIGSELCRQICRMSPSVLVLVERSENALFNIHRELVKAFPALTIVPCIADITDAPRIRELFAKHRPALVLHAAAHKHVPIIEWNPIEGVKNNIFGTRIVADLANEYGADAFVMISTDKAVNPSSVMGATKRAAELYVQSLSAHSKTRFVTVRFGNVLGSAGSVVPIFREQIARGGPVTVTHPEMKRYFMTIPEASQLVLQAGAMGEGGEIFVLDMGEPVKIVDLARDLITLSGLRPGEDIEIVFSGIRPGEKLFEELAADEENADKTRHPKIFVGRFRPYEWQRVIDGLAALHECSEGADDMLIRERFMALVPEYKPASMSSPQADVEKRRRVATEPPPAPDAVVSVSPGAVQSAAETAPSNVVQLKRG